MSDDLYAAAREVWARAHAPYSKFHVGVAIRTADGRIFTGANVENASYPEGWCAETSAIGAMIAAGGERRIAEVCVVGDCTPPITPCGGCRQRIAEFAPDGAMIHSADLTGVQISRTLADLLPAAFRLTEQSQ